MSVGGLTPATQSLWGNVNNIFGGNAVMTSGFRTASQNAAAGGASHSDHLNGTAFDFDVPGMSSSQIANTLAGSGIDFGKMIVYGSGDNHVHLSSGSGGTILQSLGGNKYSQIAKGAINSAKNAITDAIGNGAVAGLNSVIPGAGSIVGGVFGLGSGGSWFDQFKKWITDSSFFQRAVIIFVGFIFLWAAFTLFSSGVIQKVVKEAT